ARDRVFCTPSGRARFVVHPLTKTELAEGELLMMTIRSHDQYNTTIYGLDDRYRGIYGSRRVVLMNADDLAQRDLSPGDVVHLSSRFAGETRRAKHFTVVAFPIPRRCAATYFPEANVLVPLGAVADKSNTPASKSIPIRVSRSEAVDLEAEIL